MVFRAGYSNSNRGEKYGGGNPAGSGVEIILAKSVDAVPKNSTGDFLKYSGFTKGTEEVAGSRVYRAYARIGDVEEDVWCYLIKLVGKWEVLQSECDNDD